MDIEQARTFLAITAHGSFVEASRQLHLTQSTVSARIQKLEDELGAHLFIRNRSGASLTQSGKRFLSHAKRLILTSEQAKHDIGLPNRYEATLRIGGRIALWEGLLPEWIGCIREAAPNVAIRSEIGFEEDLMSHLIDGTLDIGLMYTPTQSPGLTVEHLFDETLVLISSRPDDTEPGEDYIYVDWGPGFYSHHSQNYPELELPPQYTNIGWLGIQLVLNNGGSCFIPERMAEPFIASGQLYRVLNSPTFPHPAYVVYPQETDNTMMHQSLELLRRIVK